MKSLKKCIVALMCICIPLFTSVYAKVMYREYGSEPTNVPEREVEFFRSCGWYFEEDFVPENLVNMYAADGREKVIHKSEVEAYKKVGWYTEPVVTMYARDGRTDVFYKSEVEAQQSVGWYTEPLVHMYAYGGKTEYFLQSEVDAQKTVGWFTEPFVTMYARDGRACEFRPEEVEAQKSVGWYIEPFVTMYTIEGKTGLFQKNEVSAQKKVGWYESMMDVRIARSIIEEELQKNIEAAKKFYKGAEVKGSIFAYEWRGKVQDISNGKLLVNWYGFYDSYGFRITNQFEIINIEYALGVYLNEPTWYDASKVYFVR